MLGEDSVIIFGIENPFLRHFWVANFRSGKKKAQVSCQNLSGNSVFPLPHPSKAGDQCSFWKLPNPLIRSYLKNGKLVFKPKLGTSQWISQMNSGQLQELCYPSQ